MKPMKSMLWLWKQTLTLLWIQKTSEDNSHHGCLNKGAKTHERFTSIMQLQKQCIHPPMEELFSGQQSFYGLLFIDRNWHKSVALGAWVEAKFIYLVKVQMNFFNSFTCSLNVLVSFLINLWYYQNKSFEEFFFSQKSSELWHLQGAS